MAFLPLAERPESNLDCVHESMCLPSCTVSCEVKNNGCLSVCLFIVNNDDGVKRFVHSSIILTPLPLIVKDFVITCSTLSRILMSYVGNRQYTAKLFLVIIVIYSFRLKIDAQKNGL